MLNYNKIQSIRAERSVMNKDFNFLDILNLLEKKASEANSTDAEIEYTLSKKGTAQGLEALYHYSINRLADASYTLDSLTTTHEKQLRPDVNESYADIHSRFYNYEKLSTEEVNNLNSRLLSRTINSLIRDLTEFLSYYLLHIYELSMVIEHSRKGIKFTEVESLKRDVTEFEKSPITQRFKLLKKLTKANSQHRQEIASLYKARNVFAHFEGVVQEKFCTNNGKLEILWPVNDCKLKNRKTGKLISYSKVKKPFKGDDYESFKVTWLSKPKRSTYNKGDSIQLSTKDAHDLIFFFWHIFNEIQEGMIRYSLKHEIPARKFETYQAKYNFNLVIDNNDNEDINKT